MHSARWFLVGQRCVLLALLLHLHVAPVQPFNVAVNSSRSVFAHRKAVGKQFGYSVTFKRDQTVNYLVVGTPLASDHKGLQSSGSTYRVALQDGGFNNPANIPFEEPYPPTNAYSTVGGARRYTERRDFQRLGAVVTTPSLGEDGVVLSCAPNYQYNGDRGDLRQPIGTCYMMYSGRVIPLVPCKSDVDTRHAQCYSQTSAANCAKRTYVESLGYCQAGFSAAFTPLGGTVVVGAPGSEGWHGALFAYDLAAGAITRNLSTYNPQHAGGYSARLNFQYLGYSVAFGELNGNELFSEIVASAPRYSDVTLRGLVYVFERTASGLSLYAIGRESDPSYPLQGQQSGAYFGYKVLSFDINGDKLDDIVVSAPMYSDYANHLHDVGRVYVFLQTKELRSSLRFDRNTLHVLEPPQPRSRARFGHAIANGGDVNDDGYIDLFIGEPFGGADGNGVVHLYAYIDQAAGAGGIRWLQTITAQQVSAIVGKPLTSFGFSVAANFSSNPEDKTPDLLVGAPDSGAVVYIRSSPVAHIITRYKTFPQDDFVLDPDNTTCGSVERCFVFQICSVLNRNEVSKVQVNVTLTVDARMAHIDRRVRLTRSAMEDESEMYEKTYQVSLEDSLTCWDTQVYFKTNVANRNKNIQMSVHYALRNTGSQSLPVPVVIDQFDQVSTCDIFIKKDCRETKQCLADLSIEAKPLEATYQVDSNYSIEVQVLIQNRGDPAGNALLRIAIPIGVTYQKVSVDEPCVGRRCIPPPSCSPLDVHLENTAADSTDNVVLCAFGELRAASVANGIEQPAIGKFTFSFSATRYNASLNRINMASRVGRLQTLLEDDYDSGPLVSPDSLLFEFNLTSEIDEKNRDYRNNFASANVLLKADLQLVLLGSSQPEQLLLNISAAQQKANISNAKQLSGFEILHNYEVRDVRKTRIAQMDLIILWPLKLGDLQVLYLTESPVITRGNGTCRFNTQLDPLGLFSKTDPVKNHSAQSETVLKRSGSFFGVNIDSGSPDRVVLNCANAICAEIRCSLTNVTDNAIVQVRSYLWWSTLLKLGAKEVAVASDVSAKVLQLASVPEFTEANWTVTISKTVAVTDVVMPYDTEIVRVPLWAIILAVVLGVLLLLVVLVVLVMCGFFKRRRPPTNTEQQQQPDMLARFGDSEMIPNEFAVQSELAGRGNPLYSPYYQPVAADAPHELQGLNGNSNSQRFNRVSLSNQHDAAFGRSFNDRMTGASSPSGTAFGYTEFNDYSRQARPQTNSGSNVALNPARMQRNVSATID